MTGTSTEVRQWRAVIAGTVRSMVRPRVASAARGRLRVILIALAMAFAVATGPAQAAPVVSSGPARTLTRFSTSRRVVVLTIDTDGIRGYMPSVLATLESRNVRVAFGVTGQFAQSNPDLVERMAADGDQIMNHSWDHPDFTKISSAQRASELQRTAAVLEAEVGIDPAPYFRAPYGNTNASVLTDLAADGYSYNVYWSVDPQGWRGKSAATITQLILAGVTPGAIVLMHTTDAGDAAALPGVIDQLRAEGYSFDTVDDLTGVPPVLTPAPEQVFFPETGHWLSHGFLAYWNTFGGLPVFGYPLTGEISENGVVVQYFQRARFEWHPGVWPSHFDVELGLLGVTVAQHDKLLVSAPFQPVSAATNPNCTYYPESGHFLCAGFREYWEDHGGLAIFGYPISEEFTQNGVTVQYFERQRLEYYPENPPAWQVEGGLLGTQVLAYGGAQ